MTTVEYFYNLFCNYSIEIDRLEPINVTQNGVEFMTYSLDCREGHMKKMKTRLYVCRRSKKHLYS